MEKQYGRETLLASVAELQSRLGAADYRAVEIEIAKLGGADLVCGGRILRHRVDLRLEIDPRLFPVVDQRPVRLADDLAYWPGFPWGDLARIYDAVLPMTYYTFRVQGPAATAAYVGRAIEANREGPSEDEQRRHREQAVVQLQRAGEEICRRRVYRQQRDTQRDQRREPGRRANEPSALNR